MAEYREAIRLMNDYPDAHYNLGNVLGNEWPVGQGDRRIP